MSEYKPIIGLEIHAELKTQSKMFCSCKNDPDEKRPNFNVCPICMAHPGTLPVANKEAIRKVIKTGLALNCQIPLDSKFDRKNYFYPDLPKGYQISQYDKPLCQGGFLKIGGRDIKIRRIHLEEDTGSLIHPEGSDYSLVDLNRAGVPLMELVTEPDIFSGQEARMFAEELRTIFIYLGVSDADMDKGQMRVEVNISLSKDEKLGTKVEIKNLNSFRIVEKSINYEIERQAQVLEEGGKIIQETRGWDDAKEITFSQREKEEAHDYRYFPEPDLPALNFSEEFIQKIRIEIPELPGQRRSRFINEYNLEGKQAEVFVLNKDLGEYFENVISELEEWLKECDKKIPKKDSLIALIKLTANYISSDLQGLLAGLSVESDKFLITAENFAEFIFLIHSGKISSKAAKEVLSEMFRSGADPSHIVEDRGLEQVSDESEIEKAVKEAILANPKAIEDYKKGKEGAVQFLIGRVMAATRGKAKPEIVSILIKKNIF